MTEFIQHLINGLGQGAIYALIALGYTMVFGILQLINFAHSDVYMVGAFIGYYSSRAFGLSNNPGVFSLGVPVLGICYGMQTMAAQLGGEVESSAQREFGYAEVRARGHSGLLRDIEDRTNDEGHGLLDVWMSHGDRVARLPAGFKAIASTPSAPLAGMADEARHFYGLQFHPEVTHTRQGARILQRFV
ncbi:MAG: gamma-glutamyl-gamma-aminobutyrate hydrolase family protein, partial [Deltaproteobacteria bacterium]|nr:gamma-glutamyl-gamma-aminobutyrate hydrolase family protein [Deltaproteobacteria bacterium]